MLLQMGRLIRQLRKQNKITQAALGSGITSKSEISRIENGQRIPDIFVLNALMQRLGKSLGPFEIVVSNREYELLKKGDYTTPLQTIVMAEGEYFKDIREAMGLSQEQFSSDICARETISKIENGRTPQNKKIQTLLEKLGEPFEKYYGFVVAQEYEVYELVLEYQQKRESAPEEAAKLRREIEERIDGKFPVNRQFLESSELMECRQKNTLTTGEVLAGLERCLRYTMPEYDGELHRIPRCQEAVIVENIIDCMEALQRREAAGCLAKKFLEKNCKKLKIS